MFVLVAGSRGMASPSDVIRINQVLDALYADDRREKWHSVVSGGARGVDQIGEEWARAPALPLVRITPNWTLYGRSAPIRRNADLVSACEFAVVFWDGESRGSVRKRRTAGTIRLLS